MGALEGTPHLAPKKQTQIVFRQRRRKRPFDSRRDSSAFPSIRTASVSLPVGQRPRACKGLVLPSARSREAQHETLYLSGPVAAGSGPRKKDSNRHDPTIGMLVWMIGSGEDARLVIRLTSVVVATVSHE
jgi:hypothetical protein